MSMARSLSPWSRAKIVQRWLRGRTQGMILSGRRTVVGRVVRFKFGPIAEDPGFDPEGDGWVRLREPRPGHLLLIAVPLGIVMAAAVAFVWSLIVHIDVPSTSFVITVSLPGLLTASAALLGFMFVHETLHALPAMIAGSPREVVVGFWPRHLAAYVVYTGALAREAQLISGVTPFVALTLVPFGVALMAPSTASWMAGLSVLNTLGSAADLIMLLLLVRQVPRGAVVRSQGFATWWRPTA